MMISGANDWTTYCHRQRDWLEDLRELLMEVEDRLPPASLRSRVLDKRLAADRQIEELKVWPDDKA
jgi:hypothetical protein